MTIAYLRSVVSLLAVWSVFPALIAFGRDAQEHPEIIYGDDDRQDMFQSQMPRLVEAARSTAVMIGREQLHPDPENPNFLRIEAQSLSETIGVCATERFATQPSVGFCSSFLVAPSLVATAGHCFAEGMTCDRTAFVFGFAFDNSGRPDPTKVNRRNVYYCSEVVAEKYDHTGADKSDFAIIRLDRTVENRAPLNIRRGGAVTENTDVAVIGYPDGLPVKIAAGARVRSAVDPVYFVTNLDTFGGNSGSAVMNIETNTVEGILVRGEQDYDFQGGCLVSRRCGNNECDGEEATKSTVFADQIPTLPIHNP